MKGRTFRHRSGWGYAVDIGSDPSTGKRRRKVKVGFERERDARAALSSLLNELHEGRFLEASSQTLGAFLVDEWLPSREARVRPNTLLSYRQALEGRVVPRLGALELRKIRPRHVVDLYRDLLVNGGRDPKRGPALSARTVAYTGMVLTRALEDAVRLGYIGSNPAKLVERPKARPVEMKVWTAEESRTFLAFVQDDRLRALWILFLTAGLRRGEALGLRWSDLDLDAGRMAIRRTLVSVDGRCQWSEPKTDRSRRVVGIDTEVMDVLRAHKRRQTEERWSVGHGYKDEELVFATVSGGVLHPDNITNTFDRLVKASGLPRIRLHDLRHSAATLLLEERVPLKVVSERLGHSSIAITGDLYQHVTEHMQDEAAATIGRVLLG